MEKGEPGAEGDQGGADGDGDGEAAEGEAEVGEEGGGGEGEGQLEGGGDGVGDAEGFGDPGFGAEGEAVDADPEPEGDDGQVGDGAPGEHLAGVVAGDGDRPEGLGDGQDEEEDAGGRQLLQVGLDDGEVDRGGAGGEASDGDHQELGGDGLVDGAEVPDVAGLRVRA